MTNRGNRDRTIGSRAHCMRNRRAVHPSRCTSISRYVSPTRERRSVSRRTSCDSCISAFQECRPHIISRCFINYSIRFFFFFFKKIPSRSRIRLKNEFRNDRLRDRLKIRSSILIDLRFAIELWTLKFSFQNFDRIATITSLYKCDLSRYVVYVMLNALHWSS